MRKDVFVSVCMITKNEERYLARALESTAGLADELIVVDTGSTDATVEIAKDHGARVYHFDWIDDFAAARNESLRHARGEWILVLDGDEYLAPGHAERLRRMLEEAPGSVVAYRVYQTNLTDETSGRILDKSTTIRVFRNRAHHRYQFPIHEQIVDSLKDGTIEPSDIDLMHYGFIQSVAAGKKKGDRNRSLLLKLLDSLPPEHPHRAYVHMQLGTEYRRMDDPDAALEHFTLGLERLEAIATNPLNRAYGTILVMHYVVLTIARHEADRALETVERALKAGLDTPSIWFARGWTHIELGHLAEGVRDLLWSIALGENASGREEFLSQNELDDAWFRATNALLAAGSLPAAAAMAVHALRWTPDNGRFIGLASALAAAGQGQLCPFVVERAPEASLLPLAGTALREGRLDTVMAVAARLVRLGRAADLVPFAKALLVGGEREHGVGLLAAAFQAEDARPQVAGAWAVVLGILGRPLEERFAALAAEPDPARRAALAEMVGGARAPLAIGPDVYDACKAYLAEFGFVAESLEPTEQATQEATA